MRFMVMHKMTEELERGLAPDPAIIAGVNALVGEAVACRAFVSGEGLKPSSERLHVVYEKGQRTVTKGPFSEAKELIGGFALLRARSEDEALGWCDQLAAALGDVDLFLGPVVEPWDLGMMPKPKNPPLRFLVVRQMDAGTESDAPPDPQRAARMNALIEQMTKAGAFQAAAGLTSTKNGARVRFDRKQGKHTVIDGPFAESKELIAGYAILDLPSKAAAVEWAVRFGEIVRVNEVEVRQVAG